MRPYTSSRLLLIALAFASGGCTGRVPAPPTDPEVAKAIAKMYGGMTPDQIKEDAVFTATYPSPEVARATLQANPSDAKAHYTLGKALITRISRDPEYVRTPESSPHFKEVLHKLWAPAADEFRLAMEAAPDNPWLKYDLACAYKNMGEANLATPLFQQIVSYPPTKGLAENGIRVPSKWWK